jgi:hypothetical protein
MRLDATRTRTGGDSQNDRKRSAHRPTLMSKPLSSVVVGDTVIRWFSGLGEPMRLRVTAVTEDRIICGPWEFDRATGAEIDDLLGWGPATATGSIIGVSADPGGTEE